MQAKAVIIIVCVLSACQPMVAHRGHIQQSEMLTELKPGTTKNQVQLAYGSPSSTSSFGDETWYYIQTRKVGKAFLKPEISEQQVIAVVFDSYGEVKEVKDYGKEDAQQVVMVDKVTPTEGHSIGFIEQVLGNLGRFNAPRDRGVNPGSTPGL